jgi:hypothetical protein
MKPPKYEQTRTRPLRTDPEIEARVAELIGRANIRQLWALFLDHDAVQLPLLIPIDGVPSEPSPAHTTEIIARLRGVCEEIGASALVLVWERYGAATLTPQDAAWARALHETCGEVGVPLRAMLLSHRTGVRWIAQDDFRFEPASD